MSLSTLQQLMATIENRKAEPSKRSYTSTLLDAGIAKIGTKVTEEANELVEAACERDIASRNEHVCAEAGDLFYHVLVLLAKCDLTLADVEAILAARFGTSGLEEKASRNAAGREPSR